MAYTAYYQISRLLGEVARVAMHAEQRARKDPSEAFVLKDIRRNVRLIKQLRVEIDDFNWSRFGGVESQCFFTGMLASLRMTSAGAKSLRDTDPDWSSHTQVWKSWKVIRAAIADHFRDLAETDAFLSGDPYWICVEVRSWFEAWRENLQVYFNT